METKENGWKNDYYDDNNKLQRMGFDIDKNL